MEQSRSRTLRDIRLLFTHWEAPVWLLVLVLLAALGLRLYDATDPPLEFHPTRQLKGAITARYLYYQWNPAASEEEKAWAERLYRRLAQLEPPFLDALVAATYLWFGREVLWVARVYTSFFWIAAALGLYLVARRWLSAWAALAGVLYFLFLPFAVMASRSFQPDPGMVMLLVWTVYAWARGLEGGGRFWIGTAMVLGAATVLVKAFALLPLWGAVTGLALAALPWRRLVRYGAFWALLGITLASVMGYYGLYQGLLLRYTRSWTLPMWPFWFSVEFYIRWGHTVIKWLGGPWLLAALWGYGLTPKRTIRALALGWALGYAAYAFAVPYQAMTHNYYHLPLLPWIALGIAALVDVLMPLWKGQPWWARAWAVAAVAGAVVYASAVSIRAMREADYRSEPAFWRSLVEQLPPGKYIGLLQDFGMRMNYFGGRGMDVWPTAALLELRRVWKGEALDVYQLFRERTQGYDYFLVTAMGQWEQQEALRTLLLQCYPVVLEGDGYLLFDLRSPKDACRGLQEE